MIGPTCARCDHIHPATHAVGRFTGDNPAGYAAAYPDAPVRATRAEADRDYCDWISDRSSLRSEEAS